MARMEAHMREMDNDDVHRHHRLGNPGRIFILTAHSCKHLYLIPIAAPVCHVVLISRKQTPSLYISHFGRYPDSKASSYLSALSTPNITNTTEWHSNIIQDGRNHHWR